MQVREWLRQHRVVALPVVAVLGGSATSIAVAFALGEDLRSALGRTFGLSLAWGGLFYLFLRHDRKRIRSLEKQGAVAYLRHPGSRAGSLDDLWAEGTVTCEPGQIIFQEVALNSDMPLGKPKIFGVTGVTGPPTPVTEARSYLLPPSARTLTFRLAYGTIQLAADPLVLAKIKDEVTANE